MKVLFAGGGSGGHIMPCVAVWKAIQKKIPHATAHMVCSEKKDDSDFLAREGIPHTSITAWKLLRQSPLKSLRAFGDAKRALKSFQPDVVFCTGGAVSIPVAWAAHRLGIPIVLHESDAVSGRANRMIGKWAKVICMGFPNSVDSGKLIVDSDVKKTIRYPLSTINFTGNPIRPGITQGSRVRGLALTSLSGTRPILLVLGGSQGAQAINHAVIDALPALLSHVDILHLTGMGKSAAPAQPGYWSLPFAHDELADLYAIADLALSRAGAGTIAELAACGIPALLVPVPHLAHDHQTANATVMSNGGGCILIPQEELARRLVAEVTSLAADPTLRQHAAEAMRSFSHPDAADRIAALVIKESARA